MAAQHSQCLESWICHIPGLKVVMPSTPYDAKGLLIAASRDDNPVFVVMNKASLALTGEVPEEPYALPIGEANIVRPGTDFTIISYSRMVHESLSAAETLAEQGIDTEVIDLRSLQPLDVDTLVASVEKTHNAMVVHEAVRFGGMGGEIAAQMQEHWRSTTSTRRSPGSARRSRRCPSAPPSSRATSPTPDKIVAAATELLEP